jgi:hypothetical protein
LRTGFRLRMLIGSLIARTANSCAKEPYVVGSDEGMVMDTDPAEALTVVSVTVSREPNVAANMSAVCKGTTTTKE